MARSTALDPVAEAAIAWMVELRSGTAREAEQAAFAHWLRADPRHREAWQRLGGALDSTFGTRMTGRPPARGSRAEAVEATLRHVVAQSGQRRRMLRGALGVAGVGIGSAWLVQGSGLLPDWRADLHTATGERRTFTLADGSRLQLDARSSVDIDFRAGLRLVRLRHGQLLATVAGGSDMPFVVRSRDGSVQALGTRFMVRQDETRSLALALQHDVMLRTGDADPPRQAVLREGQAAWFDGHGITPLAAGSVSDAAAAWTRGLLQADDLPLGEVVAALKPYRLGFIRVSPQAARLRVTGVYPLDDSDATLQALAETLPIDVRRHSGGWLVRVDLAA